jgi:hypothetical protein
MLNFENTMGKHGRYRYKVQNSKQNSSSSGKKSKNSQMVWHKNVNIHATTSYCFKSQLTEWEKSFQLYVRQWINMRERDRERERKREREKCKESVPLRGYVKTGLKMKIQQFVAYRTPISLIEIRIGSG